MYVPLVLPNHLEGFLTDSVFSCKVTILVAGSGCKAAADDAASIANVKQVLLADNEVFCFSLPTR